MSVRQRSSLATMIGMAVHILMAQTDEMLMLYKVLWVCAAMAFVFLPDEKKSK